MQIIARKTGGAVVRPSTRAGVAGGIALLAELIIGSVLRRGTVIHTVVGAVEVFRRGTGDTLTWLRT